MSILTDHWPKIGSHEGSKGIVFLSVIQGIPQQSKALGEAMWAVELVSPEPVREGHEQEPCVHSRSSPCLSTASAFVDQVSCPEFSLISRVKLRSLPAHSQPRIMVSETCSLKSTRQIKSFGLPGEFILT